MKALRSIFVFAAAMVATIVLIGTFLSRKRPAETAPGRAARPDPISEPVALTVQTPAPAPDVTAPLSAGEIAPDPPEARSAGRLQSVAGRVAVTAVATVIGFTLLAAPASNGAMSDEEVAEATERYVENRLLPTPTPTPAPVVNADPSDAGEPRTPPTPAPETPVPGEVAAGGDQPTGPVEVEGGSRAENLQVAADFLGLRDQLEASIAAYNGQVGGIEVAIAVTDLQTGETISVEGNRAQRTGCTINMFALLAITKAFEAGQGDPSWVTYSVESGIGGSFPPDVKNFLTTVYGNYDAGLQAARQMMADWGMEVADFDHVPYYGTEPYKPNILTALETNDVLTRLWRRELFTPEWTDYAIGVLRNIRYYVNYILPGQLPPAATVAHKIGYYWDYDGWVNNDAGIVTFTGADGQEKAYAITYMSQKARTEQIGYSFGAKLSRDVWDWFAVKYGANNNAPPAWSPPAYDGPPPPVTASPTSTPAPTGTPQPTATPTPPPSATATPKPTAAPPPTPAPTPTPPPPPTLAPTPPPAPTATPWIAPSPQ